MVYAVWSRVDPTVVIIRLSQPSLAGVGDGAELGNISHELCHKNADKTVTTRMIEQQEYK